MKSVMVVVFLFLGAVGKASPSREEILEISKHSMVQAFNRRVAGNRLKVESLHLQTPLVSGENILWDQDYLHELKRTTFNNLLNFFSGSLCPQSNSKKIEQDFYDQMQIEYRETPTLNDFVEDVLRGVAAACA